VAFDVADGLTRRQVLKQLGLLGVGVTGAASLDLATADRAVANARRAFATVARAAPKPPPDVTDGLGAWQMIDWGNAYEAFVDVPLWKSRGWGGFAAGIDRDGQDFTPSSQLGNKNATYEFQRFIEGEAGDSFPKRCHADGCEAYIALSFSDAKLRANEMPPWGDWFDEKTRADVVAKFGRLAAFSKWVGVDGLAADAELGLWDSTRYPGNTHTADETRARANVWGREIGTAIFKAHPSAKLLVYYWNPPGGWEDSFVYGEKGADMPMTAFWLGYLEAMAKVGDPESRFVVVDAFFYKPTPQVKGASLANALKYHTQGSIAWLSQHLAPDVWNVVCDRIDISLFSWAGTDSNDDGFYKHTGEPAFADQLALFRRYSMGTRRANFTLEGAPDRYCWLEHDKKAPENANHKFDQANNWYVADTTSGPNKAPGGHLPGLRKAAEKKPIDTKAPKLVASASESGDGTFTIRGSARHLDGIRCVRAYVHPDAKNRLAARMKFNVHSGTYLTDYDDATQDFTFDLKGKAGQYVMVTAVSVHDQEHSVRVRL
jgi:hypothetical protein